MKKLCFVMTGSILSAIITAVIALINYIFAFESTNIPIGHPVIGGEGEGRSGFGVYILYDLNEIRFDYFTLIMDFIFVLVPVMIVLLLLLITFRHIIILKKNSYGG